MHLKINCPHLGRDASKPKKDGFGNNVSIGLCYHGQSQPCAAGSRGREGSREGSREQSITHSWQPLGLGATTRGWNNQGACFNVRLNDKYHIFPGDVRFYSLYQDTLVIITQQFREKSWLSWMNDERDGWPGCHSERCTEAGGSSPSDTRLGTGTGAGTLLWSFSEQAYGH